MFVILNVYNIHNEIIFRSYTTNKLNFMHFQFILKIVIQSENRSFVDMSIIIT